MNINNELAKEVSMGNEEKVRELLTLGADPNYINRSNDTPLVIAAEKGYFNIVKLLVDRGADVNSIKNFDIEEDIYDYDDSDYECQEEFRTALSYAAENGYFDIVKYLVDKGADINFGSCNKTSLMYGAKYFDIVKYLVDHGAKALVNEINGRWKNAIFFTSGPDTRRVVEYLLDHGLDIELEDGDNRTLLSRASSEGRVDLVRILIDHGANINVEFEEGKPLLTGLVEIIGETDEWMTYFSLMEVLKVLIEAGAEVDLRSDESPLGALVDIYPVRGAVIKLLIDAGAIDYKNKLYKKLLKKIHDTSSLYSIYLLSKDNPERLEKVIETIRGHFDEDIRFALYATAVGDLDALIFVKENFNITFNTILTEARGPQIKSKKGMWKEKFYIQEGLEGTEGRYTLLSLSAFNNNLELTRFIYETVTDEFNNQYNSDIRKVNIELLKYLLRQTSIRENALSIAYELCNKDVFRYLYRQLDKYSPSVKDELYIKYFSQVKPCKDLISHITVDFTNQFTQI